jgi:hypothetical protein
MIVAGFMNVGMVMPWNLSMVIVHMPMIPMLPLRLQQPQPKQVIIVIIAGVIAPKAFTRDARKISSGKTVLAVITAAFPTTVLWE